MWPINNIKISLSTNYGDASFVSDVPKTRKRIAS